MKKLLILVMVCFTAVLAKGQAEQATDVEQGIFKINFLPIAVSYEMRVGPQQTIMFEPGMGFNWSIDKVDNYYFNFSPFLGFYYRYYYNFDARNAKGKRTARNSVNFVGVKALYMIYTNYANFGYDREGYKFMTVGPVWGIQRNYPKNFSLGINLGPALSLYPGGAKFDFIADLTLGFHLNGKKK